MKNSLLACLLSLVCLLSFSTVQGANTDIARSSSGTTYDKEEASVVWPFNDAATYATAVTVSPEGAFSTTAVDLSAATVSGAAKTTVCPDVSFVKIKIASKPETYYWNIKPAKGLTFTPTKVSFYIARGATDGKGSDVNVSLKAGSKTVDFGDITPHRFNKTQADDKHGSSSDYTTIFTKELTAEQQSSLSSDEMISLVLNCKTFDAGKELFVSDVQIHGTLSGTVENVAKFTVSAKANLEAGGSVKVYPNSEEFEQGASVKLTAEKKFGYKFVNWTDAAGKVVSDKAEFTHEVNANADFTANFEAINTYELAFAVNGGNDYQVSVSPAPVMVDDKMMYEEGTVVTLTATSNKVVKFNNWQDGSTSSEYLLTMNADHTDIVAEFAADDYIAIWDFIRAGNSGRIADFYSDGNDAATLVLADSEGNTTSWLDKSELGAGGYEGRPAGVNWNKTMPLGTYAWQISFYAEAFTDIKVAAAMLYNYNAYTTQNVEYSIDKGATWTKVGSITMSGTKKWTDGEFSLPAAANNQPSVMVRFIADKTSSIDGSTSDNDGIAIGAIYVTGTAKLVDDGTAPVLESTVPAEGNATASINGKIILTFDEKVKVKEGVVATLGTLQLQPEVTGKVVTFSYKNLNYSTPYTFTLPAGAVSDLTDNAYDKAITIKFTTKNRPVVAKVEYDRIVKTVDELVAAINEANTREDKNTRFRIFIHNGTYKLPASDKANETKTGSDGNSYPDPTIYLKAANVSFIGESRDGVVITNTVPKVEIQGQYGPANVLEGIGKGNVIRLEKDAVNNYFQHLTIKSSMGDSRGRDIEVNDNADKTIWKDVCLWGYQDTYVSNNQNGRFYFEGGLLRGRTDFLCGKGDVFFNGVTLQMCEKGGYIAVPSVPKKYGYIFRDCEIIGEKNDIDGNYTLGRPWGEGTPIALFIDTKMTVKPSAVGWNDMGADGYPVRFAEYNSTTATGTIIDLKDRKKTFGPGKHPNNPVLTKAEADAMTLTAVLGGGDDWDPTTHAEQAPAPTNVKHNDNTIVWDNCDYASLWAVLKDGEIIGFTTKPSFTLPAVEARASEPVYSVRAANEMGGLGDAVTSVYDSTFTGIGAIDADSEIVSTVWYNLQGQRVSAAAEGLLIRVDTLASGRTVTTKVLR